MSKIASCVLTILVLCSTAFAMSINSNAGSGQVAWSVSHVPVTRIKNVFAISADNQQLFAAGHDHIVAYNASTGAKIWDFSTCNIHANCEAEQSAPVVTADGVIVVLVGGGSSSQVVCLDTDTGKLKWSTPVTGGFGVGAFDPVAVAPGVVALNFEGSNMTALDSATGAVLWSNFFSAAGNPHYQAGYFWFTSEYLYKIDVHSGKYQIMDNGNANLITGSVRAFGKNSLGFYCSNTPANPAGSLTKVCAVDVMSSGSLKNKWVSEDAFSSNFKYLVGNDEIICNDGMASSSKSNVTCLNAATGKLAFSENGAFEQLPGLAPQGKFAVIATKSSATLLQRIGTDSFSVAVSGYCSGTVVMGAPLVAANSAYVMLSHGVDSKTGCIVSIQF